MSLDSVTLLISMGLGLKAGAPSKDSCGREDILYNADTFLSEFPLFLYKNRSQQTNVFLCTVILFMSACMCQCVCTCTWLACDILLDLLWRLVGSPSLILSMLQPHDSMVFRDSLTDEQYNSLSCKLTTQLLYSVIKCPL